MIFFFCNAIAAGRTTTNEELEEMLEQGNPAVFTQGVRLQFIPSSSTRTIQFLLHVTIPIETWHSICFRTVLLLLFFLWYY